MKTLLIGVVLLSACGAPVVCREPHGLELVGPVPGVSSATPGSDGFYCNSFERAVETILTVLDHERPADPRLTSLATKLDGWQVQIAPAVEWRDGADLEDGSAECKTKQIVISDLPLLDGPLTHELIHVAQDCHARGPEDPKDPAHSHWTTDGPLEALLIVQGIEGELYWDNPKCFDHQGHYVGPTDGTSCEATP